MTKKVVQQTDSKSYFELKRQQTLAGFLTLGLRNASLHVTLETSGRVVVQALSGLYQVKKRVTNQPSGHSMPRFS
jgi:hypothetical protein